METKKLYDYLYGNFTVKSKNEQLRRPEMASVKHSDGHLFVSDGHLLAKVNYKYPDSMEGKSVNKDGEEIANNLNYNGAIPNFNESDVDYNHLAEKLYAASKNVYKITNKVGSSTYHAFIKTDIISDRYGTMCNVCFRADHIKTIFGLFDIINEKYSVRISGIGKNILMVSSIESSSLALSMGTYFDTIKNTEVPIFSIEEALNFNAESKKKQKNWYEQ